MNLPEPPFFSVIVCSVNPWKFAQINACYEALLANVPHEIIAIRDASSLAEGYNRGLRRARGDIVIFSHDDILILDPDFAQKISRRMRDFDILGFAGTRRCTSPFWWHAGVPLASGAIASIRSVDNVITIVMSTWNTSPWPVVDNIQAIDGLCMIARRDAAEEIGFDEKTFDGFHLYDLDFSFSAYLAGKKLGVCCDIPVIHASEGDFGETHARYGRLFTEKFRDVLHDGTDKSAGTALAIPDYRALREIWQKDIFRRAQIALQRRGIKLPASSSRK
ncbi:MAG: glycosyltransferase family protein [Azoarcus sp.]|jgi:glycosyltransferase involved in cell wall biosynthesis|nr:glycosyltransferase family protein [Azoarcus sp.]